jgi:hypothetical protein
MREIPGVEMEVDAWLEQKNTRAHKDLEWFGSSERNTLYPLFCIAPERAYSTELVEASGCVYVMPEKGLNELRARQA